MKKSLISLAMLLCAVSISAQERELLIIGTMHQVPSIVARSYSPLLKAAIEYAPDAILTEDIMPGDSLSLVSFTPRFAALADSALKVSAIDESRMASTLLKPLGQMSNEDFLFLRDSFLRRKDRANYSYYAYLAEYGINGSGKPLRNESDDLTHKLAIAMGIRQLLPIDDHHTDTEYNSTKYKAIVSGAENGDLNAYNRLNSQIDKARVFPALTGRLGKFTNKEETLDKYYQINSLRYVQHTNELTDAAMALWDGRNERMAQHIADQMAAAKAGRAILVVGAGHVISIRNALAKIAPSIKVVTLNQAESACLRRITLDTIKYSHMGQLVIDRKGNCYASFLQNYGNGTERLRSETSEVALAQFPLSRALADDFSPANDVEFHRIGGLGDTFLGQKAASIFKDNSMCLDGDIIHLTFQFLPATDDIAHLFKTDYNIKTGTFSGNEECMISYKGTVEPFTIKAVGRIIESEGGVAPQVKDNILELVSQWSKYKGWWYATLACAGKTGSNGLVVRTKDFVTMEYVAMPPFNQDGMAEVSSIIKDGKVFVACRQNYGIFKLLLSYYDLRKGVWGPVTVIPDGNSRPWFFTRRGKLYLMNTPDKPRKFINISEITLDHGTIEVSKVSCLQDCGYYYATASYRGRMYMVVTLNTESFGELDIW